MSRPFRAFGRLTEAFRSSLFFSLDSFRILLLKQQKKPSPRDEQRSTRDSASRRDGSGLESSDLLRHLLKPRQTGPDLRCQEERRRVCPSLPGIMTGHTWVTTPPCRSPDDWQTPSGIKCEGRRFFYHLTVSCRFLHYPEWLGVEARLCVHRLVQNDLIASLAVLRKLFNC